ncbi:hypothetical protein RRG08_037787 [Elysia crispata]|uniref:Uncharacterized protein n=1 Tax=Elysia crispata TaxID=231223 RepID=A0AAE1EDC4_9GAST|nr:hypothetical protein RRG08_037787 [Elysia crispata]
MTLQEDRLSPPSHSNKNRFFSEIQRPFYDTADLFLSNGYTESIPKEEPVTAITIRNCGGAKFLARLQETTQRRCSQRNATHGTLQQNMNRAGR